MGVSFGGEKSIKMKHVFEVGLASELDVSSESWKDKRKR